MISFFRHSSPIPSVVQASEWIEDSQAVKFVGSHALRYGDLHLFGEATPKELEVAVVVKRMHHQTTTHDMNTKSIES